jgi:peptidyl-prolyl cis-trans isomerase C
MFESMRKPNFLIVLLFLFSVGLIQESENGLAAQKSENSPSVSVEDVIAHVDDERIDVGYLTSYLSTRPGPAYSQVTVKTIEQRLEELVTSEVLYRQALRIGLDKEPEIRLRIQQILAQSLLEEKVNRPVHEQKITDQQLQAYYNEHINEFRRPAQVRLADILVSLDPVASSEQRMQKKAKAEEILAEILADGDKRLAFRKLMLKYSHSPEKYAKGSTGFFDIEGKPIGLDPNLARQAFKLNESGQVCQQVIEAADGYHIIMLTGKREPVNRPFEKVKERLRQRMYRERIELAQTEYIESLKQKCRIKINQDVLDELVREQQAKANALEVETRGDFPAFPKDANVPPRKPRGPR